MSDFSAQLRDIAARLPVQEPARSRILLEISTDMEDLFGHLLATGTPKTEALRSVVDQFELSDQALLELAQVHSSPMACSLEGLSGQARSTWERVVLGLVALFVIVGLGGLLLRTGVFLDASPIAYVLAGIILVGLGMGAWTAKNLFRTRGAGGPIPRRGLKALPGFALILLVLGMAGVWLELYRSALVIRSDPGMAMVHLVRWLHLTSATLVVALSGSLLTALLWFFLENRAAHLEERAAAQILEGPI